MTRLTTTIVVACLAAAPAAAQDADLKHVYKEQKGLLKEVERLATNAMALASAHLEGLIDDQQSSSRRRDRDDGPEITEQFSRNVRIGRNGLLDISNVSGDITITGGGGDEARITAVKRVRHQDESTARTILRELEIQVSERATGVEVRTEFPSRRFESRRGVSVAVDYTVTLPTGSSATVRTVSGDLRVTNLRGEVRAEAVSGDVFVSSIGRLRSVGVVSGNLDVENAETDDLSMRSISGDVRVRGLKGRTLELDSVSGDIRVSDTEVDRVRLKTISGDVDFAGQLSRNGRYELQTHSGDVRITAPGNTAFDLEANTFNGDVRSDFALQLRGSNEVQQGRLTFADRGTRGPRTNREIRATSNNGGALLTLRSFSGDIVLLKR